MKHPSIVIAMGLVLITGILAGCATGGGTSTEAPGAAVMGDTPGERAFQYRVQAAKLDSMAERLEMEAQWYAQHEGQDSEQVKRLRGQARELRAAAEEAHEISREYRSQLPHNQVY